MRALAALTFLALPAFAETGPTPQEFAAARTACAAEVQPDCLFLLATEVALANPDIAESFLNDIAYRLATSGDVAGAERTLALTTPGFPALAALGRNEEAAAALEKALLKAGMTKGEPVPDQPGEVEVRQVAKLLKAGQVDEALRFALAIGENLQASRADAFRLIVDHQIAKADFAAAADTARLMTNDSDDWAEVAHAFSGVYADARTGALASVVRAQAMAGDLAGATALTDGLDELRAQITARAVLAQVAFDTGAHEAAKAQRDLVLSAVRASETPPAFQAAILTETANLALQQGDLETARQHAEAAYRAATTPTVRKGSNSRTTPPSRMTLMNLATALDLVGVTEKATTLFERAALRSRDDRFSLSPGDQQAALLVAQVRRGDPKAADTRAELVAMDDPFLSNGRRPLHAAALQLVKLGFLQDALLIADELEALLRADVVSIATGDPAEIYTAILAKDPAFAPQVLKDSLGARSHFRASLALARSLAAAGQPDQAATVLNLLEAEHQRRAQAEDYVLRPQCALATIALTQDDIGLPDDAAETRKRGLTRATGQIEPSLQAADLLILANSFPDRDAAPLFGFGCLEYPG